MLAKLTVQNVALIDKVELCFSEGMNVLSGETGSGKSVILDSIDFVLGAKADKSMIRHGKDDCFVRAEFDITDNQEVKAILNELEIEEDDLLMITRRFTIEGKSTIKVNGTSVSASMLRKITAHLVDVHGQSEHFYLLKEANQLKLLDKLSGEDVAKAKTLVQELLSQRKGILAELSLLGGDERERDRRLDILRFQIDEIKKAELKEGEEEELLLLREKISHAERILDGLQTAEGALSADGYGIDALRTAYRSLSAITKYDEQFVAIAERLESAIADLSDLADCIEEAGSSFDFDDREASRVEARLDEIKALKKKYGYTVSEIFDFLQKAEDEFELLSDSDARYELLQKQLEKVNQSLYSACLQLTIARKKSAFTFAKRVTDELKTLNITSAQFEINFAQYTIEDLSRVNSDGLDGVQFLFSANAGEPLKELGKIISGGEMSRFMLAIKTQLSAEHDIGTYIFDEIDAGISGKTARVVAEKFCKIATKTQIIAVSHLAQIAAAADKQFYIEKIQTDNKTTTVIRAIEGDERLCEISRLIGGEEGSDFALKHAEELLQNALIYKNSLS